jgi:hypothetical protein
MDTVLCSGDTALVVFCPSRAREFATKMAPVSWEGVPALRA